jgi:opacity protein-like surface antigen
MKKTFLLVVMLLLGSLAAFAADKDASTPKAEVYGGFSYLRAYPGGGAPGTNSLGWNASLNWNVNHWFGLKGDFDGHYCCAGQKLHNFMFGPQLSFRKSKATFFVHGLGGASHGTATGISSTAGAWAAGGGVDWNFGKHLAWRVAQADYVGTRFGGATQHNLRISSGLVWRWGTK